MIISLYSTKGGCGKSSTATLLCSAIAEYNLHNPEAPLKTLVLDGDPQGSLLSFANKRAAIEADDMTISYQSLDLRMPSKAISKAIDEAHDLFDILILDCPGFYDKGIAEFLFVSDFVIVPTGLFQNDLDVALPTLQMLVKSAEQQQSDLKAVLSINRTNPSAKNAGFFAGEQRAVIEGTKLPVLQTEIHSLEAIPAMHAYGLYLHELALQKYNKTSIKKARMIANSFFEEIVSLQ